MANKEITFVPPLRFSSILISLLIFFFLTGWKIIMKLNNRSNKFHTKLQDTKSNVEYTLGSAYNGKVFFCEANFCH